MPRPGYKYDYQELQAVPEGSTYFYATHWIRPGARVLDVGSGPGHFAAILRQHGCSVDCVEVSPKAAAEAAKHCNRVYSLDLSQPDWSKEIEGRYDTIVLLDILEHLSRPDFALLEARQLLLPGGSVVVSVPNVAHAAARLPLMLGEWNYEREGLLDDTHVRFFTHDSVKRLLDSTGFSVREIQRVDRRPTDELFERAAQALRIPPRRLHRLLVSTEGFTWQFAIDAVPTEAATHNEPTPSTLALSVDIVEENKRLRNELAAMSRLSERLAPLLRIRRRFLDWLDQVRR